jgi:hypothetical protein
VPAAAKDRLRDAVNVDLVFAALEARCQVFFGAHQ